jgi:sulfonate transport system permease protein
VEGHVKKGLVLPALLLLAWHLASRDPSRAYAFAPLGAIASAARELLVSAEFWSHVASSAERALIALLVGASLGLAAGLALGSSKTADRLFGGTLSAFRQVPYLGLAPLLGLWLGTGDPAKLVLVSLAAFFPLLLGAYEGVRTVDPKLVDVARVLGLSRKRTLTALTLPAIAPFVATAFAQAITFSWIATVGSEMLLVTDRGVGALLQQAAAAARMDRVVVCLVVVALTGVALDAASKRLWVRA